MNTLPPYLKIATETAPTRPQEERENNRAKQYHRLACAVMEQALEDLRSRDPVTRAEARAWLWLNGSTWLEMLGLEANPEPIREQIVVL